MSAAETRPIDPRRVDELPAPMRSYARKAVGERRSAVRTVRLRHGGTFRPKLDGDGCPFGARSTSRPIRRASYGGGARASRRAFGLRHEIGA